MCLIFISLKQHPVYKLVIAANRDEFYDRKTAVADFWPDSPTLLAGRDLEAKGTWMGITKSGRIAMLTNYRDPKNINKDAPSRGQLVSDYLVGNAFPEKYLDALQKIKKQYNGFNILVGDVEKLFYLSNYKTDVDKIESGLFGLSNHLLQTTWPKVVTGVKQFEVLLKSNSLTANSLFGFLYNEERAADSLLPDTGIGLERERALSSMFIKTPNYGSRCSTVILIDHQNQVEFSERTYDVDTFDYDTKVFRFKIESA